LTLTDIDVQYDMVVVGYHRIGTVIDGENFGQLLEAILYPATAVFKTLAGLTVLTTKKGAAYTAVDAVIVRGGFKRDPGLPWLWHGITP